MPVRYKQCIGSANRFGWGATCATLVRSRQSMQLVRSTPCWFTTSGSCQRTSTQHVHVQPGTVGDFQFHITGSRTTVTTHKLRGAHGNRPPTGNRRCVHAFTALVPFRPALPQRSAFGACVAAELMVRGPAHQAGATASAVWPTYPWRILHLPSLRGRTQSTGPARRAERPGGAGAHRKKPVASRQRAMTGAMSASSPAPGRLTAALKSYATYRMCRASGSCAPHQG